MLFSFQFVFPAEHPVAEQLYKNLLALIDHVTITFRWRKSRDQTIYTALRLPDQSHRTNTMPRNVVIVGLGEKCINLVVEEELSVISLKERICQRKVGLFLWL